MKKFYIKVIHSSIKRGYNRTIEIYTINKRGTFSFLCSDDAINTASYRGDEAVASRLLHEKFGFKWSPKNENYSLMSKNIKLIFLP